MTVLIEKTVSGVLFQNGNTFDEKTSREFKMLDFGMVYIEFVWPSEYYSRGIKKKLICILESGFFQDFKGYE